MKGALLLPSFSGVERWFRFEFIIAGKKSAGCSVLMAVRDESEYRRKHAIWSKKHVLLGQVF